MQLLMCHWLEFYEWVTGPEGPSPRPQNWEYILENDHLLDEFIKNWKASFNKETKKGSGSFNIE